MRTRPTHVESIKHIKKLKSLESVVRIKGIMEETVNCLFFNNTRDTIEGLFDSIFLLRRGDKHVSMIGFKINDNHFVAVGSLRPNQYHCSDYFPPSGEFKVYDGYLRRVGL